MRSSLPPTDRASYEARCSTPQDRLPILIKGEVGGFDAPRLVPVVAGGASVMTAAISLVKYRMRLKFYKYVFDRNSDRDDLESAGKVVHPRWTAVSDAAVRRRARKVLPKHQSDLRSLPAPPPDDSSPTDPSSGPASAV